MKQEEVIEISDVLLAKAIDILRAKNKDYSVDDDALAGFKFAARDAGITNYQAWLIFARKHWGAIATFCRNGGQLESEPIEERLKDMINYCTLLKCLIEDSKDKTNIESYHYNMQDGKITYPMVKKVIKDEAGKVICDLTESQVDLLVEVRKAWDDDFKIMMEREILQQTKNK